MISMIIMKSVHFYVAYSYVCLRLSHYFIDDRFVDYVINVLIELSWDRIKNIIYYIILYNII